MSFKPYKFGRYDRSKSYDRFLPATVEQHAHIAIPFLNGRDIRAIVATTTHREMYELNERICEAVYNRYDGTRASSTIAIVRSALEMSGFSEQAAYDLICAKLGKWSGLTFTFNPGNGAKRQPLRFIRNTDRAAAMAVWEDRPENDTMEERLIYAIHRANVDFYGASNATATAEPAGNPTTHSEPEPAEPTGTMACGGCENGDCCENGAPGMACGCCGKLIPFAAPVSAPEPASVEATIRARFADLERTVEFLRTFAADRDLEPLDSMRIMIDGRKLIAAGLPVAGIVANITSTWGADTRLQAGIEPFSWIEWCDTLPAHHRAKPGEHRATPAIMAAIVAGVPVWIWGGAGTGKSFGVPMAARKLAAIVGEHVGYSETNLSGMGPNTITGRDTINPDRYFVESGFIEAYRDGHVFNAEEVDAAPGKVLTLINNAIANDYFINPLTNERIERHRNFRMVVTANTNGTGAANGFVREFVDFASRNRFACAMFFIEHDKALETFITEALESKLIAAIEAGEYAPIGF